MKATRPIFTILLLFISLTSTAQLSACRRGYLQHLLDTQHFNASQQHILQRPDIAQDLAKYTRQRWSVMFYYGRTTTDTLGQVLGCHFTVDQEKLYSFEISRVFPPQSRVVLYLGPLFSQLELAGNITVHDDQFGTLYEFIPYIKAEFRHFPWENYLPTTIGLGEGVSYITKVPFRERRNSDQPKRFLNYLMLEVSVASPRYPDLQLVFRLHHRSGVFGLYNANNSGATAVGLGLRWYFDRCSFSRQL